MNKKYYIIDDQKTLVEFEQVGERDKHNLELKVIASENNNWKGKTFVFPRSHLSETILGAYQTALAVAKQDEETARKNCERAKNQYDKAKFRVIDFEEKISAITNK